MLGNETLPSASVTPVAGGATGAGAGAGVGSAAAPSAAAFFFLALAGIIVTLAAETGLPSLSSTVTLTVALPAGAVVAASWARAVVCKPIKRATAAIGAIHFVQRYIFLSSFVRNLPHRQYRFIITFIVRRMDGGLRNSDF